MTTTNSSHLVVVVALCFAGADFECKRHAAKARLKGSFRALLATSFQSLNELVRLNTHEYPIVNMRVSFTHRNNNDVRLRARLMKQPTYYCPPSFFLFRFWHQPRAAECAPSRPSRWPARGTNYSGNKRPRRPPPRTH